MKNKLWMAAMIAASVGIGAQIVSAQQRIKAAYKVSRLSAEAAAVACIDGNNPEIQKFGNVLIVTCHPVEAARGR